MLKCQVAVLVVRYKIKIEMVRQFFVKLSGIKLN
jgi:hypothetical protein